MSKTYTSKCLNVFYNILVIMIGGRTVNVKFHKSLTLQPGKQSMNLIEQPELADILLLRPVGHYVEIN